MNIWCLRTLESRVDRHRLLSEIHLRIFNGNAVSEIRLTSTMLVPTIGGDVLSAITTISKTHRNWATSRTRDDTRSRPTPTSWDFFQDSARTAAIRTPRTRTWMSRSASWITTSRIRISGSIRVVRSISGARSKPPDSTRSLVPHALPLPG